MDPPFCGLGMEGRNMPTLSRSQGNPAFWDLILVGPYNQHPSTLPSSATRVLKLGNFSHGP